MHLNLDKTLLCCPISYNLWQEWEQKEGAIIINILYYYICVRAMRTRGKNYNISPHVKRWEHFTDLYLRERTVGGTQNW